MSIAKECMVVNLNIGMWQGYRRDKEAARKITKEAGAENDAASVNKHLVPKTALDPIVSAAGAIRSHFYNDTLPWKDNGDRILSRQRYMRFIETHAGLVRDYDTAVDHFLNNVYLRIREQAAFRMGDLFKSQDYPEVYELRRKFYVNLDIDAVTEAGDFRVALDNDALEARRKQIEASLKQRLGTAMQDVWKRLAETVGRFAERMANEDATFHASTVEKLEEIVELLPALNIMDDPNLEQMRRDIQSSLIGYDAKTLRKDKAARSVAATEAQKIMDTMKGFMTAFGGDE